MALSAALAPSPFAPSSGAASPAAYGLSPRLKAPAGLAPYAPGLPPGDPARQAPHEDLAARGFDLAPVREYAPVWSREDFAGLSATLPAGAGFADRNIKAKLATSRATHDEALKAVSEPRTLELVRRERESAVEDARRAREIVAEARGRMNAPPPVPDASLRATAGEGAAGLLAAALGVRGSVAANAAAGLAARRGGIQSEAAMGAWERGQALAGIDYKEGLAGEGEARDRLRRAGASELDLAQGTEEANRRAAAGELAYQRSRNDAETERGWRHDEAELERDRKDRHDEYLLDREEKNQRGRDVRATRSDLSDAVTRGDLESAGVLIARLRDVHGEPVSEGDAKRQLGAAAKALTARYMKAMAGARDPATIDAAVLEMRSRGLDLSDPALQKAIGGHREAAKNRYALEAKRADAMVALSGARVQDIGADNQRADAYLEFQRDKEAWRRAHPGQKDPKPGDGPAWGGAPGTLPPADGSGVAPPLPPLSGTLPAPSGGTAGGSGKAPKGGLAPMGVSPSQVVPNPQGATPGAKPVRSGNGDPLGDPADALEMQPRRLFGTKGEGAKAANSYDGLRKLVAGKRQLLDAMEAAKAAIAQADADKAAGKSGFTVRRLKAEKAYEEARRQLGKADDMIRIQRDAFKAHAGANWATGVARARDAYRAEIAYAKGDPAKQKEIRAKFKDLWLEDL